MKTKDKREIFTKTENELKKALLDARKALLDFNLELSQNKLRNTRQIFWKKKEIAWILTALKEKGFARQEENKNEKEKK